MGTSVPARVRLAVVTPSTPELVVSSAASWRAWLNRNATTSSGVWLVLAKAGTIDPTSLTYDQALEEALCFGWIDGQLAKRDDATYVRRFTPRRSGSNWSKRNVEIVGRLKEAGRMAAPGEAAVRRAEDDGTWAAAYSGSASSTAPDDLAAALEAEPRARAMFDALTARNRYAVLRRIEIATTQSARSKKIEQTVVMLADGRAPYPQKAAPDFA
jgi:uncharacterized protein YdeI (YjbR/CyaY-like superfamily)